MERARGLVSQQRVNQVSYVEELFWSSRAFSAHVRSECGDASWNTVHLGSVPG